MTSSQPSTSPKTQTSKSYPGKGQRSEIPGCHELGAGVINPGERVTHLRKQQSSGSNPDSAKPTSALSAIHYGHKQGPSAFPCPRPLGCWVHLSQKKKKSCGQRQESQRVISYHGMKLRAPFTAMMERSPPLHSDHTVLMPVNPSSVYTMHSHM